MSNKPSIRKYFRIIGETINNLVLKNRKITIVIVCVLIINSVGSWLQVKTTAKFADISDNFRSSMFEESLKIFLMFTLITLTLKHIPMVIFNYYCQDLQRTSYLMNLREVMQLNYADYHSKTPGDLHYAIFIKSYASPMTCQVALLDFPSIVTTVIFGATRVGRSIDFKYMAFFILCPLLYMVTTYFYIKRKMQYHYELLNKEQYTEGKLTDKLLNYEAIKSYNLEKSEIKDFYNVIGLQTQANIRMGNFEAFSIFMLSFSTNLPFILMLVVLLANRASGGPTEKFLELTLLYLGQAGELKRLGNELDQLVEYLNQINFSEVEKDDPSDYDKSNIVHKDDIDFNSDITYENVSLFYKDKSIISDFNLKISKYDKVAIVGNNGTGKSTFIKSLLGFTKYTGHIKIDGKICKHIQKDKMMDVISYIPQDDCTSDDTLINNILLGLNKNDFTNLTRPQQIQKIKDLAIQYNAHDTFKSLENGYETQVGSRGNKISGGQRQKINLIRAVLKDAPIFVFDEATAAMDKKYEKELIQTILTNLSDKTILMIVHGKDYLSQFDKIIFLNNGHVEAVGSYAELLGKNSNFKKLLS